jgi:oxalate decarboxylase/phosphoglucose isomerase-like protein (cupin superfamily)
MATTGRRVVRIRRAAGVEYETLYRDRGDHLTEIGKVANHVGDVSGFAPPGDIHRVHNTGDVTAISLHVYGADLSADGVSIRRQHDLPVREAGAQGFDPGSPRRESTTAPIASLNAS